MGTNPRSEPLERILEMNSGNSYVIAIRAQVLKFLQPCLFFSLVFRLFSQNVTPILRIPIIQTDLQQMVLGFTTSGKSSYSLGFSSINKEQNQQNVGFYSILVNHRDDLIFLEKRRQTDPILAYINQFDALNYTTLPDIVQTKDHSISNQINKVFNGLHNIILWFPYQLVDPSNFSDFSPVNL